jgi:hypothetical protein
MPEPVFVVGCGRSGTTLAYELLATHEAFSWISTWSDRTRRAELAALNGLFRRRRAGEVSRRGVPRPSEGYRVWDSVIEVPADGVDGILTESMVDDDRAEMLHRMAAAYCRWGRGPVFLNKNTRNTRRLGLLGHVFPQSRVLHIVRSPLDVVSSLLEVRWWPGLRLWTESGRTPADMNLSPVAAAETAARLWVEEVKLGISGADMFGDRFRQVRFEDLVEAPGRVLAEVAGWLGVGPSASFEGALARLTVRRNVSSYESRLTREQQEAAWSAAGDLGSRLGYVSPTAAAG